MEGGHQHSVHKYMHTQTHKVKTVLQTRVMILWKTVTDTKVTMYTATHTDTHTHT